MNISSNWWIALIGVGAIAVAIGNIQFSLARDHEKSAAASSKALSMLSAECERNLARVDTMRKVMASNQIPIEGLETSAWTVVSSGGLLAQVEKGTLSKITETYYLVDLANRYHSQVLDMSNGLLSVIGGVDETRKQYLVLLGNTLNVLEPKLKDFGESQSKRPRKSL